MIIICFFCWIKTIAISREMDIESRKRVEETKGKTVLQCLCPFSSNFWPILRVLQQHDLIGAVLSFKSSQCSYSLIPLSDRLSYKLSPIFYFYWGEFLGRFNSPSKRRGELRNLKIVKSPHALRSELINESERDKWESGKQINIHS